MDSLILLSQTVTSVAVLATLWFFAKRRGCTEDPNTRDGWDYTKLKQLVEQEQLPAMVVDLKIFDSNTALLAAVVRRAKKTIRLATKSVRVPALIRRCLQQHPDVFQGLMCYSIHEALFLAEEIPEARDFLIGYPCVQPQDLAAAYELKTKYSATVYLMVDCVEHVELLDRLWHQIAADELFVCVDVDVSYRLIPGLHVGVHRSPCRSLDQLADILTAIQASRFLRLGGVMAYEAQVAGLPDAIPMKLLSNLAIRAIKWISMSDVKSRRQAINSFLHMESHTLRFFNGGGTGNVAESAQDLALTEVTVGSGLLQSAIFDNFMTAVCKPAFCFGLRITRSSDPHVVCCHSGGFIASGPSGCDRSPSVFLPRCLAPLPHEGFGEVQTPLVQSGKRDLVIGDPVFFRPAKAGEIAERFNEYLLTDGQDAIVERARTYRGHGRAFY